MASGAVSAFLFLVWEVVMKGSLGQLTLEGEQLTRWMAMTLMLYALHVMCTTGRSSCHRLFGDKRDFAAYGESSEVGQSGK
jgi:hypothetical protein